MEFSLFKNLDKAFDNLERTVADTVQQAALSVVDEFPERSRALEQKKLAFSGASASLSKTVADAWQDIAFEERKAEWAHLKEYLEKQPDDGVQWQQRAKLAETKLLQLCDLLLNCPDPLPHLQITASASTKVLALEEQNKQLRQAADSAYKDDAEVQGLLARFQALEAQHRELQDEAAAKDKELASWRANAAEVEATRVQQKEQLAELLSIKSALKALRVEYDNAQSQLFEFTSQRETQETTAGTDVDVLLEQLERANAEVRELKRERDSLTAQLQSSRDQPGPPSAITAVPVTHDNSNSGLTSRRSVPGGREAYWEVQVQLRDKQVERLQAELDAANAASQEYLAEGEMEVAYLRSHIKDLTEQLSNTREELSQRPSQQDIKALQQRCEALAAMVDTQVEAEGGDSAAVTELLRGAAGPTAVQTIVQQRNRKLAAEVTTLKQALDAKESELQQAVEHVADLERQLHSQLQLVKKLEDDLQAVFVGGAGDRTRLPVRPAPKLPSTPSSPVKLSSAESLMDPGSESGLSSVTAVPMVDIVARQRDRFRQRVTELEEELRRVKEDLSKARARIQAVSADNVSLYEKLRYMERYSHQRGQGSGPAGTRMDEAGVALDLVVSGRHSARYQCGPFLLEVPQAGPPDAAQTAAAGLRSRTRHQCFGGVIDVPSGAHDVEQQYARAYEAQLNPFKAFRQGESEQRIKNLGFGDRALLTGSKLLAGSKVARIFVAAYAALLHGFIMLLLYYSASPCTSRYSTIVAHPPQTRNLHLGWL